MSADKERVRIRLKLSKKLIIIPILVIISIAGWYYYKNFAPITSWNYNGQDIFFRVDLREAQKVLSSNEFMIQNELANKLVKNVTIAFKPANETDNPAYVLSTIEIVQKLRFLYVTQLDSNPGFGTLEVKSYDNLPGKIQNPIIALVHPVYSNETSVTIDGHVIFIKGKYDPDPVKRTHNLDLATVKFLMIMFNIKV